MLLQNYKQTCKQITYACNSDTIYAMCWNGQTGANYKYLQTALQKSTLCYGIGSIDNVWGTLACVAFPSPEEEAPPEEYPPSEALPPSEEVLVLVGPAEGSPIEEFVPESSPEYASAPEGTGSGLCDYAASGEFQFISYLDGSGIDAPDGVS